MSYIVIARKFRPQNFDEVVGQEHITTTLKHAIEHGRVAHAYLFSGPRGIGKTSTARILAKALNCEKGPAAKPCNKCSTCEEITSGSSLDVIEIDGASNRGIDEVRALRENVKFAPAKGRYKVYIIDEVHMLTQEAFNALLKTLEEPPAHVKFVFATTAPNKVPSTILSRCQRFDFRRISTQEIVKKLKEISQKEKIAIEEEALFAIARTADGSIRDAESILDQLASFSKEKITPQDLSDLLGTVKEEQLFGMAQKIIERDAAGAIAVVDEILNEGKDLVLFMHALIEYFRNMMVTKVCADPKGLIETSKDMIERIKKEAKGLTVEEILYVIYSLLNALEATKRSPMMRVPFEMALVKLSRRESVISLDEIVKKLDEIDADKPQIAENPLIQATEKPRQNKIMKDAENEDPPPAALPAQTPASHTPADSGTFEKITMVWQDLVHKIKAQSMLTGSLLEGSAPARLENNRLVISFPRDMAFHKESLEKRNNLKVIEKMLFEAIGKNMGIDFELDENKTSPAQVAKEEPVGEEPILKSVLKKFKANIVRP
ncbi:MAG: DNA polymerase III subunit gamma/tau [Candidatus Omnitrophota bacterium]